MYDPVYLPANAAREVAPTTHMGDVLVSNHLNLSILSKTSASPGSPSHLDSVHTGGLV